MFLCWMKGRYEIMQEISLAFGHGPTCLTSAFGSAQPQRLIMLRGSSSPSCGPCSSWLPVVTWLNNVLTNRRLFFLALVLVPPFKYPSHIEKLLVHELLYHCTPNALWWHKLSGPGECIWNYIISNYFSTLSISAQKKVCFLGWSEATHVQKRRFWNRVGLPR
jgi:hypothetical protein